MADDRGVVLTDALLAVLKGPGWSEELIAAMHTCIRHKLEFLDRIPLRYFSPDAPPGALARLQRELEEHGEIKIHPDAWIPQCLVDEGIESLPREELT